MKKFYGNLRLLASYNIGMKSLPLIIVAALATIGFAVLRPGPSRAMGVVKQDGTLVGEFGLPENDDAAAAKLGTHPGGIGLSDKLEPKGKDQLAAFSAGCFWGTEYTFRHVKGVVATAVGYTGGTVANPTYEQVCTHTTGHAETCLVEFDPSVITYKQLLHVFWVGHDPTTMNRQGPDIGDSYRSAIWTYGDGEMKAAIASRDAEQKLEKEPIVTEIKPAATFWLAEDYHQQYDQKTGTISCPLPRRLGK